MPEWLHFFDLAGGLGITAFLLIFFKKDFNHAVAFQNKNKSIFCLELQILEDNHECC